MWRAVARAPDFFAALAFTPDGRRLWEFCRPLDPTILTGLPRGGWAAPQKRRWIAEMLGAEVPVITCSRAKKRTMRRRATYWSMTATPRGSPGRRPVASLSTTGTPSTRSTHCDRWALRPTDLQQPRHHAGPGHDR